MSCLPNNTFLQYFCSRGRTQSGVWLPSATIKDDPASDPAALRDSSRWGVTRGSEVNLCNSPICIQMTNDRIFLSPNVQCRAHEEHRGLPLPRSAEALKSGTLFHINLERRSATSFAKLYHSFCPARALFVAASHCLSTDGEDKRFKDHKDSVLSALKP